MVARRRRAGPLTAGPGTVTGGQAVTSAAAVAAFGAGAARGHEAAALELAELDAALDAAAWRVFEVRAVVR